MARKPMVTRNISTTTVTVLGMDTELCEPMNKTCIIAGRFKDEKKLFKAVAKNLETETFKVVKIVDIQLDNTLYGQTLEQFIENSEILESR